VAVRVLPQGWVRNREQLEAELRTTAGGSAAAGSAAAAAAGGRAGGAASAAAVSDRVTALSDRIDTLTGQQARYARSMEEVVQVLADDTTSLAKQARSLESQLTVTRGSLGDVRDAVIRYGWLWAVADPRLACGRVRLCTKGAAPPRHNLPFAVCFPGPTCASTALTHLCSHDMVMITMTCRSGLPGALLPT
jgi:hypothetical protein